MAHLSGEVSQQANVVEGSGTIDLNQYRTSSKSGYKGVYQQNSGKYLALKSNKYLGLFETAEKAAEAVAGEDIRTKRSMNVWVKAAMDHHARQAGSPRVGAAGEQLNTQEATSPPDAPEFALDSDLVCWISGDHANATETTETRKEERYSHTWATEGKLGLVLGSRPDALPGVMVKLVSDTTLPDSIQKGMVVERINGDIVDQLPKKEVLGMIKSAGRPLTLVFKQTIDPMVVQLNRAPATLQPELPLELPPSVELFSAEAMPTCMDLD